jgi:hypothetical protein
MKFSTRSIKGSSFTIFAVVILFFVSFIYTGCKKNGCTDPVATNYDSDANSDDGSCIILGCTNPASSNYNPKATQNDGSCIIEGCTDPLSLNYNPNATTSNGNCVYSRDTVLGNYLGTLQYICSLSGNNFESDFSILVSPSASSVTDININIADGNIVLTATVSGTNFTIDNQISNGFSFNGNGYVEGNLIFITLNEINLSDGETCLLSLVGF